MSDADLPTGWRWTRLGDIAEIQGGITKNSTKATNAKRRPVPYLRVANVQRGYLDLREVSTIDAAEPEIEALKLRPGDVLFNEGGDRDKLGRGWVWTGQIAECIHQNHVFRARLLEDRANPYYVSYYGNAEGQRYFHRVGKQTTNLASINMSMLRALPIPMPSSEEQTRIVDALDSYLSRLDDAIANLERVRRNLGRYRSSVLQAAVEGRLVPTEAELAKAEGRTFEPASVLLKRILIERRKRWEATGKKGKYEEPVGPNTAGLPELPEGWCWASVQSLFWDAGYGTSQKCLPDAKGPPVLRIPNIQGGAIDLADLKFATDPDALGAEQSLEQDDFVFIRTNGSKDLVGRGALVRSALHNRTYFASYLIRLRLVPLSGTSAWLALSWHGPPLREQVLRDAASSAGQHNVSLSSLRGYAVALPPGNEQVRIVAEVERLASVARSQQRAVEIALARVQRLRQSILKWAFEGKLVDQDPTDEPAELTPGRSPADGHAANRRHRVADSTVNAEGRS